MSGTRRWSDALFPWSKRHAAVLWLATGVLTIFGIWAALRLPSGIYPEVDFPRIVLVAHAGDAAASTTVASVTRILEESVATVPGMRKVRSKTIRGSAELSLEFAPGTDMARALAQVEARANEVKSDLPAGAELVAERLTPTAFPVLTFNLTGPIPGADLLDLAEIVVRPAMSRVPGVGRVEVLGGDVREVSVQVSPERAAAFRLDADRVATLLGAIVQRATAGHLVDHHQTVTLEATSQPPDAIALGDVPIAVAGGATIPLSAVAFVGPGTADRTAEVSGPGGETVLVSIARMEGASTPEVAAGAIAARNLLLSSLPPGVKLEPVYDQAALVDDSIASVRDAIVIGVLLCVVVLGLFLRDVRAGLIAGVAVPLTLAITFGAMWLFGQTLNLMSLGGMAVAIGLVVDDAVVVVEAITRHREEGLEAEAAAAAGVSELFAAVVGTTATTIVVFLPLALLSGVVGRFFQALAVTLSAAVGISLVVAVLLVPIAAGKWLRPRPARGPSRLDLAYGRWLRASLGKRGLALAISGAVLLLGVVAMLRVPTGFLPTMDESGFVLDYFLPAGTSLADTSAAAARIETILATVPEVATWSRRTGAELGPAAATSVNRGDIMVKLVPSRKRARGAEEIMDDVRDQVARDVPQARTEFIQVLQDVLNDLAGAPHPVEVKLFGPDYDVLATLAAQVTERIGDVDGLEDVYGGVEGVSPVLRFVIDPAATHRLGLTPADVASTLDASVRGRMAATIPYLDRLLDVRVRTPDDVRFDPERLSALPLVPGDDALPVTTLSAVTHARESAGATELDREDLRPVVVVSAEVAGRDLGSIMRDVQAKLADFRPPPGYTMELGGTHEQQRQTFADLGRVLALALLAVLVVLVAQFGSLRLPLVVLATAPLALVGALVTLWALDVPLNASSLMGTVLLVGLVVKNGILLLEHSEGLEATGMTRVEALVQAGERRIRPILMTTLCTVFGLLPLALGLGAGADLQRPLAVAVIGGLALSTAVSLFLVPSLALLGPRVRQAPRTQQP